MKSIKVINPTHTQNLNHCYGPERESIFTPSEVQTMSYSKVPITQMLMGSGTKAIGTSFGALPQQQILRSSRSKGFIFLMSLIHLFAGVFTSIFKYEDNLS